MVELGYNVFFGAIGLLFILAIIAGVIYVLLKFFGFIKKEFKLAKKDMDRNDWIAAVIMACILIPGFYLAVVNDIIPLFN